MSPSSHFQDEQHDRLFKSRVLIVAFCALFLILIIRLIFIQVIDADTNIRLSKENAMRLNVIKAPRGRIMDRNGVVMARNRPSYAICVLPYKLKHRKLITEKLLKIRYPDGRFVFDSTDLNEVMHRAMQRRFDATRLLEDVSMDMVSIFEEHSMELPGIIVETESRREYTLGQGAFHLLGYIGEVPEEKYDSMKKSGYAYGDLLGKAGIEKQYEKYFKGKNGSEYIEVNAYGKSLGTIHSMPNDDPVAGDDVILTIDARLQHMADSIFPDTMKGAVVALDPRNGNVLALYSSPAPDPNIFSMSATERNKVWQKIIFDKNLPLNNRAVQGTYSPGSTFKLITALAGVASGRVKPPEHMPRSCTGSYRIGGRIAHCWKLTGHGFLNLYDAVKNSCNIYFYQLGLRLGDSTINKFAALFGFGGKTGIDISDEKPGWLSGEEAYNRQFASRGWVWTQGLVLDLAIGQAQLTTPIQLCAMVGAMGNGYNLYRPHIFSRAIDQQSGKVKESQSPFLVRSLGLDTSVINIMHTALRGVLEEGGTGGRAAVPGIIVGGKTGSSQNPQGDLTHALFVACAPVDNPVIAIAVVVENAGHGGSIAAPIAGELLRYFFRTDSLARSLVDPVVLERLDKADEEKRRKELETGKQPAKQQGGT